MLTKDFGEITRETARYKYNGSPMCEYLHTLAGDTSYLDADCGDSNYGWVGLMGKWVLESDTYGACYATKYATSAEAGEVYANLESAYYDWTHDAACNLCGNEFASEEGSCWVCGSFSYRPKGDAFDPDTLTSEQLELRNKYLTEGV